MPIQENFRLALNALSANKLRASLTMLGIMIGVAAVITLVAIGDGVTRFVADQFIGLGTNLVFILPPDDPERTEPTLTMQDAALLADPALVPDAQAVAPVLFLNTDVQYAGNAFRFRVLASTPEYAAVRGYEVARGRFLDDAEYVGQARVAVLGSNAAATLFGEDIDPVGADIKVRGVRFRVIGVLESEGGDTFGSRDDLVIVPLTTAQARLVNVRNQQGQPAVNMILVQAINNEGVGQVVVDATNVLRQSHNITFRDEDDFLILTQQDFLSAFGAVTGVLTLFLGAIAGISLLVGGIGIMNIMLVSVTERTREIGLRKAVGARRRDILGQFLTEAMLLSVIGGIAGITLGTLGAMAVRLFVPSLDTSVTLSSIFMAVGFSMAIGLFFGIYPAAQAAALHPIQALRFE